MGADLVPAGPDPLARARAIAQASLELAELEAKARELTDEEALDAEHSTAIVSQSASSLTAVETRLQHTRGVALRTRMALDEKRKEMQALFDAQMQEALAIRRPLEEKLKRLEEGLWTLSLYAGDEERIVQLQDGEPAPLDTPITVRQLVLAMDEECAVAAEDGGIDARSIEEFDAWQERLMREVRPGMRVIGTFNTYDSKEEWDIWPTGAARPESFVPHAVTERLSGRRLKIVCDRSDTVWRKPSRATGWRYDDEPAKVRASSSPSTSPTSRVWSASCARAWGDVRTCGCSRC